jgi:hypothetical protein
VPARARLAPLESHANFLYVPTTSATRSSARCSPGIVVRGLPGAIPRLGARPRGRRRLLEALGGPAVSRRPLGARGCARPPRRGSRPARARRRAPRARRDGRRLYDHFLEQLAFHAGFDLVLEGAGDLETGDHHTAEDAALALGQALDAALGDRAGSRATATPSCRWTTRSRARPSTSAAALRRADARARPGHGRAHALEPRAGGARLDPRRRLRRDPHHVAEAAFKAVGRALRVAVAREGAGLPSTKGLL